MGYMVDGIYHVGDDVTQTLPNGEWERSRSTVRHRIGDQDFPAEASRYHLFVAWNCPWAHRALLIRAIMGLDDITVSYARPNRNDQGWIFDAEGAYSDALLGARAVHEVYSADPMRYTGRLTVPVLWDKLQGRMVSNESAEIIRMLNAAFEGPDLYPDAYQSQIGDWNTLIYDTVNNGVYRAGFAAAQAPYEKAARQVFETLDRIDAHLGEHDFLCGDQFTEADLRLFPTLARFDVAYHYAFRCNLRKISDYAHLWPYAKRIYAMPGVAQTVRLDIYKRGYFSASEKRNPLGIIPIGPTVDWS